MILDLDILEKRFSKYYFIRFKAVEKEWFFLCKSSDREGFIYPKVLINKVITYISANPYYRNILVSRWESEEDYLGDLDFYRLDSDHPETVYLWFDLDASDLNFHGTSIAFSDCPLDSQLDSILEEGLQEGLIHDENWKRKT